MTPAEAQLILGIAASFDNRKPNEEAAVAWSHALEGIRFIDARDAVVAHYRSSDEWLMPSKVIAAVKRIRSKRIAEAGDLTPPPGLDVDETREWLREARRRIGDGETYTPPPLPPPNPQRLRELLAARPPKETP